MRIGVVCEGPTDFIAISSFLKESLRLREIQCSFVDIQPEMGATNGGWPQVFTWLENNPPDARKLRYSATGLFANNVSAKSCDFIVVQVDTDIIPENSFVNFVRSRHDLLVDDPDDPHERFELIKRVLLLFSGRATEVEVENDRTLLHPAVENTEAWCVAAIDPEILDVERLDKEALNAEFLSRLRNILPKTRRSDLKKVPHRIRFCETSSSRADVVEQRCPHYRQLAERIANLAPG